MAAASIATYVVGISHYSKVAAEIKPMLARKKDNEQLIAQKTEDVQRILQAQQEFNATNQS